MQVEAAQLPRTLDDLDASAINTNYATQAGLVRTADKDKPWVPKLAKAFQSPDVKKFVEANFAGSLIPAF